MSERDRVRIVGRRGAAAAGPCVPGPLACAAAGIALLLVAPAACGQASPPPAAAEKGPALVLTEVASPAEVPASWPGVGRGADGRTRMTWIEKKGGRRHAVRLSVLEGAAWSAPVTVTEGEGLWVNWADFPTHAARADGALAVSWPETLGQGAYAYGARISCSSDGGKTWSPPFWLHEDTSETEHGFASLVPWPGGGFAAIWLDGRPSERPGDMALRARTFDARGRRGDERILDPRACECCCTAAAAVGGGLLAVYRDRSDEEIRDLSVVRTTGAFDPSPPATLHADLWENPG